MDLSQIGAVIMIVCGFLFIGCGLCVANFIEAKESKRVESVLSYLTAFFGIAFVVGIVLVIVGQLLK